MSKKCVAVLLMLVFACSLVGCSAPSDVTQPTLTMETLKDLVENNGENLSWTDFESYYSEAFGSGLYILRYPIDEDYYLMIGGGSLEEKPMYIRLVSEANFDDYIDVLTEDIDDFIN